MSFIICLRLKVMIITTWILWPTKQFSITKLQLKNISLLVALESPNTKCQGLLNSYHSTNGTFSANSSTKSKSSSSSRNSENGKHSKSGFTFSVNKKCPAYVKSWHKKCTFWTLSTEVFWSTILVIANNCNNSDT